MNSLHLGTSNSDSSVIVHQAALRGELDALQHFSSQGFKGWNIRNKSGFTPLMFAVFGRQSAAAEFVLKKGAEVNAVDSDGRSAAHWASYFGTKKVLLVLLSFGADITLRDSEGRTPVHYACRGESTKVLTVLLKRLPTTKINLTDCDKMAPVHWCAAAGNVAGLQLLLRTGASMTILDKENRSILHWALHNDHASMAQFVLESFPELSGVEDEEGRIPLHLAVALKNEVAFSQLLQLSSVNARDKNRRTPLHYASIIGHVGFIKDLLAAKADVRVLDKGGGMPIHYAAQMNHVPALSLLLLALPTDQQDAQRRTPLFWASGGGSLDAVDHLLRCSINVDARDNKGNTALHVAAVNGHVHVVEALLKSQITVDHKNRKGHTALAIACYHGNMDVVKHLLEARTDAGALDVNKRGALHWAVIGKQTRAVELLSESGVPIDQVDKKGNSPLHYACFAGDVNTAVVLLESGANVNMTNRARQTPLHLACCSGCLDLVKLLLDRGVRLDLVQSGGETWTPLDYSIAFQNEDIVKFLKERGAEDQRDVLFGNLDASVRSQMGSPPDYESECKRNQANSESSSITPNTFVHSHQSLNKLGSAECPILSDRVESYHKHTERNVSNRSLVSNFEETSSNANNRHRDSPGCVGFSRPGVESGRVSSRSSGELRDLISPFVSSQRGFFQADDCHYPVQLCERCQRRQSGHVCISHRIGGHLATGGCACNCPYCFGAPSFVLPCYWPPCSGVHDQQSNHSSDRTGNKYTGSLRSSSAETLRSNQSHSRRPDAYCPAYPSGFTASSIEHVCCGAHPSGFYAMSGHMPIPRMQHQTVVLPTCLSHPVPTYSPQCMCTSSGWPGPHCSQQQADVGHCSAQARPFDPSAIAGGSMRPLVPSAPSVLVEPTTSTGSPHRIMPCLHSPTMCLAAPPCPHQHTPYLRCAAGTPTACSPTPHGIYRIATPVYHDGEENHLIKDYSLIT